MLRTVKVELLVLALPDGGERIVPSMAQIRRTRKQAADQLDDTEDEIEDSPIPAEQDALGASVKFLKKSLRRLDRQIREQPALVPLCKKVCYRINIPTYDELLTYQDAARVDLDSMPRVDWQRLMEAVLPNLFAEDARPEDPHHIFRCWERWREEAYPNEAELPFLDGGNNG